MTSTTTSVGTDPNDDANVVVVKNATNTIIQHNNNNMSSTNDTTTNTNMNMNTNTDFIVNEVSYSSLNQIIQSVQLLLQNHPSLLEYHMTTTPTTIPTLQSNDTTNNSNINNSNSNSKNMDDIVYPYASYLLSQSSSSSSTSSSSSSSALLLHDIEGQLTCIESFISKLIRLVPELLTRQLLVLHGYQNTNTNTNTNTTGSKNTTNDSTTTTSLVVPSTSTTSTTTTLVSLRERSIRMERTANQLYQTSVRMQGMIQRGSNTIQYHTTKLYHILLLQYHMKYMIRIQLELNKCCHFNYQSHLLKQQQEDENHHENEDDEVEEEEEDFYYYDWPRDVIRTATSITTVEELLSHLQIPNGRTTTNKNDLITTSKSSTTTPIAILEEIRPMVQYISQRVRHITRQKLRTVLQYLQEQVVVVVVGVVGNKTATTNRSISSSSYDIQYEFGAVLQIYYHLHELPEIVYYIMEQIYQSAMEVTCPLVVLHSSSSSSSSSSSTTTSHSLMIDQWAGQIRTCMIQIQTMMDLLLHKQDPISRMKLYTALFATTSTTSSEHHKTTKDANHSSSSKNNILLDSIPQVYHEYIHQYMSSTTLLSSNNNNEASSSSSPPPTTFLVSLFWYRYCSFLSQTLSDTLHPTRPKKNDAITSSILISSYPAMHLAAYTILQPLLLSSTQQQQQQLTPLVHNNTEMMYHNSHHSNHHGILSWSDLATGSTGSSGGGGILGGTSLAILPFSEDGMIAFLDNPQSGSRTSTTTLPITQQHQYGSSSRTWTIPQHEEHNHGSGTTSSYSNVMTLTSTMKQSTEWKVYQGQLSDSRQTTNTGLYPLQQAFVNACTDRLMVPLQYMFHENVSISDDGVSMSTGILILPSKYDIQRFDENIRNELSLATIGGGNNNTSSGSVRDTTLIVQLIAQCVNAIITEFCIRAKSAMSNVSHQRLQQQHPSQQQQQNSESYINDKDWSITESMKHDCKIIAILYTMKQYLQSAPEKVFVAPYRATGSSSGGGSHIALLQHTKTAAVCTETLIPASVTIDTTIKGTILVPFCRTLNLLIATNVLMKIHLGIYLDNTNSNSGGRNNYEDMNEDDDIPLSFIQKDIVPILDKIVEVYLVKFPPTYSNMIVCNVVSFIIYTYLSNVTLIRPLSESIRLHITQDLTDLEMALEQFISKAATSSSNSKLNITTTTANTKNVMTSLQQMDHGKPYAELRAVRQMLFWTGLDTKSKPADDIAKSLLNEIWVKDIRPSTIFHYLFSYGPNMLSSPYHVKRISATEYVALLVPYDIMFGYVNSHDNNSNSTSHDNHSMESGEDVAFMTIMACCDSYTQRASVVSTTNATTSTTSHDASGGDPRIAQIVITFGQELLRRRGRQ